MTPAAGRGRWGVPEPLFLCVCALPGLTWFILHQGLSRLPPTHLGWVMDGDWAQHVLGWLLFRNQPWGWPLGRMPGVAWPMGTTVGFTDSNPLVSLLLKPLSPWLPVDFQFVGAWFCLCFTLQGVFGALLVREMTASRPAQLLGACLFVVAPILHARMGHDTLCAHFTLLGLFWLHFRPAPDRRAALRLLLWALAFTLFTAAVHGYLNAMVLALSLALLVRLAWIDRTLRPWEAAIAALALVGLDALVLYALGFIGSGIPAGSTGFGEISADLLTFINPANRSRLFPYWQLPRLKDEGFAYLGLGAWGLVVLAVVLRLLPAARARLGPGRGRRLEPLIFLCVLFFVYAVADHVTLAGREVLDLSALYRPLSALTGAFRASGRFTWGLHYLLLALAIGVVCRAFPARQWVATVALSCGLLLQLVDVNYQLSLDPLPTGFWHFRDPRWDLARGAYRHLALVPAILHDGSWQGCPTPFPEPLYQPVDYEAYLLRLTTNSAYVSRMDMERARGQCAGSLSDVQHAQLAPDTVYVLHPSLVGPLWASRRAACGALDGQWVCVSGSNQDAFARALSSPPR